MGSRSFRILVSACLHDIPYQLGLPLVVSAMFVLYFAGLCREAQGRGAEEDASGHYSPGTGCREVSSTLKKATRLINSLCQSDNPVGETVTLAAG